MTELQKKPKMEDFGAEPIAYFKFAELAYYKERCAVAEEALSKTECMTVAICKSGIDPKCPRCSALQAIAASETP